MHAIRVVLFPTDFSACADVAFHFACSLAAHYSARLIIVHVKQPPFSVGELVMPFTPETELETKQVEDELRRVVPSHATFPFEHQLLFGDAAIQIVDCAIKYAADVIVIGTHGRTGVSRALMGSVAAAVLRKASCPVLTVKLPKDKARVKSPSA